MSASMRKSKYFSNATNFRSKLGVSHSGIQADRKQRKMPSVGPNNETSKLLPGLCPQTARGSLSDPGPSIIPRYGKSVSYGKASKTATVQDHMDGESGTYKSQSEICPEKRRGREDNKAQGSTLERHEKCRPVKGIRKSNLPVPTPNGKPAKLIIRKSATEGDLLSFTHTWTVITRYSSAPNLCGKAPSRIPVRIMKDSKSVGSVCMKKDPAHSLNCAKKIFGGRDLESPPVSLRSTSIAEQSTNVSPPSGSADELICGTLKMLSGNGEETGNSSDLEKDDNPSVVTTPSFVSHAEKSAVIQPPSISESNIYHHNTLNETVASTGGGELSAISKIDNKPLTQFAPVVYHQSSILLLAVETDCSSDSGADIDTDTDKEKTFTSKSLPFKVDTTESGGLVHKQSDPALEQDSSIVLSRSTLVPSQSASSPIVTHETECSSESGSDDNVKQPEEEARKANEWNGSTQLTAVISDQDGEEESELSCESTGVKDPPDTSEFIRMCRSYDSAVFRLPTAASSGSFPRKRKTSRGKSIQSLNDSKSASRSSSEEESDDQRQRHPGEEEPLSDNPEKENTFLRCQNQLLRQTNSSLRADNRILLKRLEDEGNKGKLLGEKSCRLRTRVKCLKRKLKVVKTTTKKRPSDWKELVANLNGRATCSNLLVQNLRCLLKMPEETATEQNKKLQQVHAIIDLQNTELKKATVFMALHKALQRLAEIVADQNNQLRLKGEQMKEQTVKLKRGSEIIAHQQLELKRVDGETVNLKNQLHLKDKQIKEQMEKLERESNIVAQQELELKRADDETVNHLEAMQKKVLVVTQHEIALQEALELLEKQKEREGDLKKQVDSFQQNLLQVEERFIKEMNQNSVLQDQLTVVSNKYETCRRSEEETATRNNCLEEELGALKEIVNHLEAKQKIAVVVTQQENAVQENRELLEKQREREGDLEEQVASLQQNLLQVEERLIEEINQNSVLQDQLTVVSNMYTTCRRFEQEIATRNECLEQEARALKKTVNHLEAKRNKAAIVTQQEKAVEENREKLEKQEEREGDLEGQVACLQQNLLQVEERLIKEINQNSVLQDQLTVVSNMYSTCRRFEQEIATRNECLEQEARALKKTVIHLEAKQSKAAVVTQQEKAVEENREKLEKQEEREGDLEKQVVSLQQNLLQVEERLIKEINQNSVLQDQLTVVSNKYKTCRMFEEETATKYKCLEQEAGALKETVIHLEAKQNKAAVVTQQENAVQEIRELLQKQEKREGNFEQQVASLQQNLLQVEEKLNKKINQNSLLQEQLTVVTTMYENCSMSEEETATRNKCLANEREALKSFCDFGAGSSSCSEKDNLVVEELLIDGNLLKPLQNQLFHVQDSHLIQSFSRGTHCSSSGIERGYAQKLTVSEELANKELTATEKAVNVKRSFPICTCEGSCAGEESENKTHAGLLSEWQEESLVLNEAESAKKTEGNSSRFSVWLMSKCSRLKQVTSKLEFEGNSLIQEKETEKKELRRDINLLKREVAHKDKELDMMEFSLEEIGKVKKQEIKCLKEALRRLQEENAWIT